MVKSIKVSTMEKKTPLYDWHETHGGKIVPFAGFLLPIQYETGLITEHCAVREKAGIFDVSHMGEFVISGVGALESVQRLFTNDFANMAIGRVRYTPMCNENGGIIDDMVVYKLAEDRYLLVVNASNREKDAAWIQKHLGKDSGFEDLSDSYGQIALQGPASSSILASISETIPQKYYTFTENGKVAGVDCIVSQTGYTGEKGFEFYCKSGDTEALWVKLLEAGKGSGLIPCGLGARDTLRLEASMPLYGHEMDETINPLEAGLSFAVKMDKADFIGNNALAAALSGKDKPGRIRTGLKVTGKGIVREQCPVFYQGNKIGMTTSGTFLPHLKQSMAMALLSTEYSSPGLKVEAEVRGKMIEAETCMLPFYNKA
jgi:aminomethyltransferase